jgi:hypothetical protein
VAVLCLLLALAPLARANTECRLAFERWVKQSTTSVRTAPQGSGGRGGCIPTETLRKGLLDELARTRTLCGDSPPDSSAGQVRTLLNINRSFIASLAVCDADSGDGGAVLGAKPAPVQEPPQIAAPPQPVVVAPPKPVVVAPPPAPKPVVAAPPPSPPCLEVGVGKDEYALINRRCRGHTVLAVIEMRNADGETVCRGYTINQGVAVPAVKDTSPKVNYECVATQATCNKDRLGNMFPECDWE